MWGSPIAPRNVARITPYVAASGWSSWPPSRTSGDSHCAAVSTACDVTVGAGVPAGKTSVLPAATSYWPARSRSGPSRRTPATVPRATTVTGVRTAITSVSGNSTFVTLWNVGDAAPSIPVSGGCWTSMRRTSAGTAMAVSLSQYWNAWTNVMPFIPPLAMPMTTTMPRTTTPTQYGPPTAACSVNPAPLSCGRR